MQPRRTRSMPPINFGCAIASDLAIMQSRMESVRGLRREAGSSFFRAWLATYKDARHAQRAPQAWWNGRPRGGQSRTGRSGRARRPPLARMANETSGRLPLAFGLRLQAVQIRNRTLRMGRSGEGYPPVVGKNRANLPHRPHDLVSARAQGRCRDRRKRAPPQFRRHILTV